MPNKFITIMKNTKAKLQIPIITNGQNAALSKSKAPALKQIAFPICPEKALKLIMTPLTSFGIFFE